MTSRTACSERSWSSTNKARGQALTVPPPPALAARRRRPAAMPTRGDRSARRAAVPAVEPERPGLDRTDLEQPHGRPGILAQARLDLALVGGFNGVQRLLAVAERAAKDDHPVRDEPVHERRVLVPGLLLPDWPRGVPVRAVNQRHCENGHGRNVPAAADIASRPEDGATRTRIRRDRYCARQRTCPAGVECRPSGSLPSAEDVMSGTRQWSDLSERSRRLLIAAAVAETCLKVAALIDIKRRPASQIRGRKWMWATVVALVNSFGAAPLSYFAFGRRR